MDLKCDCKKEQISEKFCSDFYNTVRNKILANLKSNVLCYCDCDTCNHACIQDVVNDENIKTSFIKKMKENGYIKDA